MATTKQPSQQSPDDLMRTLKRWWKQDSDHSASWRKQAKDDFAFAAIDGQWSTEERTYLMSPEGGNRVPITFDRTGTLLASISGIEINGRHDTAFLPRGDKPGVVAKNELLSHASQWMADEADADTSQSRAFQNMLVCGMGWTEPSLSYDVEPDGSYVEKRLDPLEMYWDHKAREPNLSDSRRRWHVKADIDIEEAREMFPDASDEDLDASWADAKSSDETKSREDRRLREENSTGGDSLGKTVTIVRCQWYESEPYYSALIPRPQPDGSMREEMVDLDIDEHKQLQAAAKQAGQQLRSVKRQRRVYKQAFLGSRVLSDSFEPPCPGHFTLCCITGIPDESNGTWYGMIKKVRDPQKWANKWLTQSLHILNTTAKGGILAERDAFEDQRDAEDNYARPDAITWMKNGALSKDGPKIMPKPGQGFPAGHIQLMEFAISAIRDVSGVNLELLGLRDANQAGVLEAQRKQAGMTILATLFDSLRGFRKCVGRVRLYYIQEYLADGRMVRIYGPQGQQYESLAADKVAGRYDVIVEDAPTSPNQREQTWAQIQPMLAMFKDMITPSIALELLEYSPIPSGVVEKIRKAAEAADANRDEEAEALAKRGATAKVSVDEAKAADLLAQSKTRLIEAGIAVADAEQGRAQSVAPAMNGNFSGGNR